MTKHALHAADTDRRVHQWAIEVANLQPPTTPPDPTGHPWWTHRPVWVEQVGEEEFTLECACGGVWRRTRLADAVVAHERHQHAPALFRPDVTMSPS